MSTLAHDWTGSYPVAKVRPRVPARVLGGFFASLITASAPAPAIWKLVVDPTSSHAFAQATVKAKTVVASTTVESLTPAARLDEIRQRTGLTNEELATMFQVSRRTIYSWSQGESLSAARERRLHAIGALLSRFPNPPEELRAALRSSPAGGVDLLPLFAETSLGVLGAHLAERLGAPVGAPTNQLWPNRRRSARRPQRSTPDLRALFASGVILDEDDQT